MKKFNQKGLSHHLLLPVLAVFLVGAIGFYMMNKSNAYSYVSGVTPYSCTQDPTPTLRANSRGNCVKALQYLLNQWISYKKVPIAKLVVDGSFGPKTLDAVYRFQRMYGLGVDGIVGPKTWSKLTKDCGVVRSCTK